MLCGQMYLCGKCNKEVYYEARYKTKSGYMIPLDGDGPNAGKYHKCRSTVFKRKSRLRILTQSQVRYYKTLGIYPGATVDEIERAYNECLKEWHPDKIAKYGTCTCDKCNIPNRTKMYKSIIKAYQNIRLIYVAQDE